MSGKAPFASGEGRQLKTALSGAFATLVFIVVLAVGWALWTYNGAGPRTPGGEPAVVVVRQGAGVREIAAQLAQARAVRSSAVFSAAAQITGAARTLKAGEYEFSSGSSMASVLGKIRRGVVVHHMITIPEGMTSEMAVEALMAEPLLAGSAPVPPEGTILPETYEYQRGEDRSAVLGRMMAARDQLLADLWAQRAPDTPLKTPEEAVILASIVEKETGIASERPRIARVFVNRLNKGMKLESDPTIIYDVSRGRPLGRGIRESELRNPSPHNTYFIPGLPPTAIANPGRASLAAVMAPPPGDQIFFVADGTGGHAFAATLEEHNRNVAKWRQVESSNANKPEQPAEKSTETPKGKGR